MGVENYQCNDDVTAVFGRRVSSTAGSDMVSGYGHGKKASSDAFTNTRKVATQNRVLLFRERKVE